MESDCIMDPYPILHSHGREIFWDHRADFGIHGLVWLRVAGNYRSNEIHLPFQLRLIKYR